MLKYIRIDYNNLQSIENAERRKLKLENQNCRLKHTFINSIENTAVLTYEKLEDIKCQT